MSERLWWSWVSFVFLVLVFSIGNLAAQEKPEKESVAKVASPQFLSFQRESGQVAPCDSCQRPMQAPIPELGDPDAVLMSVSMFACFGCGEVHLIGQVHIKKASGGTFPTGQWVEWVWDAPAKKWKRRK